jgi:hypothetical protein
MQHNLLQGGFCCDLWLAACAVKGKQSHLAKSLVELWESTYRAEPLMAGKGVVANLTFNRCTMRSRLMLREIETCREGLRAYRAQSARHLSIERLLGRWIGGWQGVLSLPEREWCAFA